MIYSALQIYLETSTMRPAYLTATDYDSCSRYIASQNDLNPTARESPLSSGRSSAGRAYH